MKKILAACLSCLFAHSASALSVGDKVPVELGAKNQEGKMVRFSDFKGKFVLVFFYPKDETPGCTKEACMLRDNFTNIQKANAVIFGVSTQDEKSHLKFKDKHKLPFDLLVHSDGKLNDAFKVGTIPIVGLSKRKSILIGPDGHVAKYYENVEPGDHAAEVLADIQKLSK